MCEEALRTILKAQEEISFHLQEIDINNEPALYEKYKNDVPVIFLEDREIARHSVKKDEIVRWLRRGISM